MAAKEKLLAVIPARGGSKGLPGKNIRPFLGIPLIAHSILMAQRCPEIDDVIISTDDPAIAQTAEKYGALVPFARPRELAQDETPMWPVVRHALKGWEEKSSKSYDYLLLLDPTSPGRIPQDITGALQKLRANRRAVGVVGVSEPPFSPIWHSVIEREGWMANLIEAGAQYHRRQDVPTVYRINASLYIWRADFVRRQEQDWRQSPCHLIYEIPEARAIHIDDLEEFERAECLVQSGHIQLPWLTGRASL